MGKAQKTDRLFSVNDAHLTDVWGSALAVDTGAVTGERAARIVEWFGAHWCGNASF